MTNNNGMYTRDYPQKAWGEPISITMTRDMWNTYAKDAKNLDAVMDKLGPEMGLKGIVTEVHIEG